MTIKVMDGKKELFFQVNGRFQDGSLIDFDNSVHRCQLSESFIMGVESIGYKVVELPGDTPEAR